jgi:hypothetical protein
LLFVVWVEKLLKHGITVHKVTMSISSRVRVCYVTTPTHTHIHSGCPLVDIVNCGSSSE